MLCEHKQQANVVRVIPNFMSLHLWGGGGKERKNTHQIYFDYMYIDCSKFSLLAPSLHQQVILVLCFKLSYRSTALAHFPVEDFRITYYTVHILLTSSCIDRTSSHGQD